MLTFLFIVVACVFRIIVIHPGSISYDTYGHLYYAYEVDKQKKGPFWPIRTRILCPANYTNPYLWHWIITRIADIKTILKYQHWINILFDILIIATVSFIFKYYNYDDKSISLMILFYIATPAWFTKYSSGPRLHSLTPRLWSEHISCIYFIILSLNIDNFNWTTLMTTAILGFIVITSSLFGLQALFFISIVYSIITVNFYPIFSFISALLLALIISRGRFINSIKIQINHLKWYYIENKNKRIPSHGRSSFKNILPIEIRKKGLKVALYHLAFIVASRNGILAVVMRMSLILCLLGYFLLESVFFNSISAPKLAYPAIASFVVYSIVNIPVFLFLGESERYLNHVSFLICMSLSYYIQNNNDYISVVTILLYGIWYWKTENPIKETVKKFFRQFSKSKPVSFTEEDEIIHELNKIKEEQLVLCYPYHAVGIFRIMLETKHRTIDPLMAEDNHRKNFKQKYEDDYPYLKIERVDELHEEFNLNILLIDNSHIIKRTGSIFKQTNNWRKIQLTNSKYDLYLHVSQVGIN